MARNPHLAAITGTGGTLTWFVAPKEGLIEVRLTGEYIRDAIDVAFTLQARFFVRASKKLHHFPAGWAIYDTYTLPNLREADAEHWPPVKYLYEGGLDAAHMWCLAHMMGGS